MRLSLAVVFTLAVPALAGAEPIRPMAPTWCGSYAADASDTMTGYLDQYAQEMAQNPERLAETLAKSSCNKPSDAKRQQLTATWRQKFGDYFHLTEAENREYLGAALDKSLEAPVHEVCNRLVKDAPTLESRARRKAVGSLLGCTPWDYVTMWWVDAGPEPDVLLRAAWVRHALQLDGSRDSKGNDGPYSIAEFGLAAHDARDLQRGDLVAELDALGVTGKARLVALLEFGQVQSEAAAMTAYYRNKAKTDPLVAKVVFEVPDAAWAEWTKDAETWKTSLAAAQDVEDAFWQGKQDTLAHCASKLRKDLADYLASKHVKTQPQAIEAVTDDIGYRLATATLVCDAAAGDMTAYAIRNAVTDAKLRRGPRLHVYNTLVALDGVAGFDPKVLGWVDTTAQKQLLAAVKPIDFTWSEPKGVIAHLTRDKAGDTTVEFKTQKWSEAIWNCVQTHRIEKIEEGGQVIYHQDCTPTGKFKSASSTEKPITIEKGDAAALKVGQFGTFVGNATTHRGGPVFGYADAQQKTLVSVFGMPL